MIYESGDRIRRRGYSSMLAQYPVDGIEEDVGASIGTLQ
jgi:hypothetical protein